LAGATAKGCCGGFAKGQCSAGAGEAAGSVTLSRAHCVQPARGL